MELQTHDKGKITVSDALFGCDFKEDLVHQVITSYISGSHTGSKAQKNRSDVRGGGAKPWRQKGTGRARAGTIRSPLWRSGGVTFAAKPGNKASKKLNRRMYQAALAAILSELVRQDRLVIVDNIIISAPKTKEVIALLQHYQLDKALIVVEKEDRNLSLAIRNVPHVMLCDALHLDPVSLVAAEKVLITVSAIKKLEEKIS